MTDEFPKTPSDYVAERVKEARRARGWDAAALAKRCAEVGAPQLTAAVIANIEAGRRHEDGRRRRNVTVDEVMALSAALDVAGINLLFPIEDDEAPYAFVPPDRGVRVGRARAWFNGQYPLPSTDKRVYFSQVPRDTWVPPGPPTPGEERRADRYELEQRGLGDLQLEDNAGGDGG